MEAISEFDSFDAWKTAEFSQPSTSLIKQLEYIPIVSSIVGIARVAFGLLQTLFGILALPYTSAILGYTILVFVAGWWYPVFAVWLPHRNFGLRPEFQAWTTRGHLIPRLFRPLAFHLEHHLYPKVPSHNLPLLSARLDGRLRELGVAPISVP